MLVADAAANRGAAPFMDNPTNSPIGHSVTCPMNRRFRRIDEPLAHRAANEGPVGDASRLVFPGVLVGVELHER